MCMWVVIETAWNCRLGRGWDRILSEHPTYQEAAAAAHEQADHKQITVMTEQEYDKLLEEWEHTTG